MGVNSSFLSSNMKFRHQQQQQEENRRKNLAAALTTRTPIKKKEIVLWAIVLNWSGTRLHLFLQNTSCSCSWFSLAKAILLNCRHKLLLKLQRLFNCLFPSFYKRISIHRSSCVEVFSRKAVLKIIGKFTGKHP